MTTAMTCRESKQPLLTSCRFARFPEVLVAVGVCRFKDNMVSTVGHRNTETALQLGTLYKPSEALNIGLVDQLVPEDQILTTAAQVMTKWLAIPGM